MKLNLRYFAVAAGVVMLSHGHVAAFEARDITVYNKNAGISLGGTLTLPEAAEPKAAVLLATGSGAQNRDEEVMGHRPFKVLAEYLSDNGYAVLRLDDRGIGESGGDPAASTSDDYASDLGCAMQKLDSILGPSLPKGVIGHSEGGSVAIKMAVDNPACRFIVTMGAPAWRGDSIIMSQARAMATAMTGRWDGEEAQRRLLDLVGSDLSQPVLYAMLYTELADKVGGAPTAQVARQLEKTAEIMSAPSYRSIVKYDPAADISSVAVPWLALNGEKDMQVLPGNLATIAELNPSATTRLMAGHNHLMQRCTSGMVQEYSTIVEDISEETLRTISSWLDETPLTPRFDPYAGEYTPSPEVLRSRQEFAADRFGIFIHWGIYSLFGQGEWYLNYGPKHHEYAKAARAFYPADFDADEWASAIHDSGARYICFTTRHHDGFSMYRTAESDYNIVDGTPFGRDVLKELSEACGRHDLSLHLYYSHLDWGRQDYPQGRTGHQTGRDSTVNDWNSYYAFMNRQLTELLTGYGPIRAVWFDGWWDHDEDKQPFNWQLDEQYAMIHRLQPSCLVGNNHHENPFPGEDIQIFERDIPGQNTAGYSKQDISKLPLETCQTMNGMWGYKLIDTDYKDTPTLIRYLVGTAGMGANLLLNIGPQPNGQLPATALERLRDMGQWMRRYGETIYGTEGSPFPAQEWGTSTRKGNRLFVHILTADTSDIHVPLDAKVKRAFAFESREKVKFSRCKDGGIILHLNEVPDDIDHIIELEIND